MIFARANLVVQKLYLMYFKLTCQDVSLSNFGNNSSCPKITFRLGLGRLRSNGLNYPFNGCPVSLYAICHGFYIRWLLTSLCAHME